MIGNQMLGKGIAHIPIIFFKERNRKYIVSISSHKIKKVRVLENQAWSGQNKKYETKYENFLQVPQNEPIKNLKSSLFLHYFPLKERNLIAIKTTARFPRILISFSFFILSLLQHFHFGSSNLLQK